jgi:hypothetical protein
MYYINSAVATHQHNVLFFFVSFLSLCFFFFVSSQMLYHFIFSDPIICFRSAYFLPFPVVFFDNYLYETTESCISHHSYLWFREEKMGKRSERLQETGTRSMGLLRVSSNFFEFIWAPISSLSGAMSPPVHGWINHVRSGRYLPDLDYKVCLISKFSLHLPNALTNLSVIVFAGTPPLSGSKTCIPTKYHHLLVHITKSSSMISHCCCKPK